MPTPAEAGRLAEFLSAQRQAFAASPQDAAAVAPPDRPLAVSAADAAAWTSVARVLMNLDEFITRE
jgi:hypothetical protein